MNPEIFTLCTEGTTRYRDITSGGIPELTAADICAGLAAVKHSGAERLLLLKYAGFEREREPLKRVLLVKLSDWCRGRSLPRPGFLADMALLAIHEIADPQKCRACAGVAYRGKHMCPACEGTGSSRRPDYPSVLSVTSPQWWLWSRTYNRLTTMLGGWESNGMGRIHRAMVRDEV